MMNTLPVRASIPKCSIRHEILRGIEVFKELLGDRCNGCGLNMNKPIAEFSFSVSKIIL